MGKMDQAMLAVFSLFARTWTPALNPGPCLPCHLIQHHLKSLSLSSQQPQWIMVEVQKV